MRSLATHRRTAQRRTLDVAPETGTVARCDGAAVVVRTAVGLVDAERAASCLLAPEPGDRVLLATTEDDEVFVLAVLRRGAVETPSRLTVEGDLAIAASSGKVEVCARDGVALASPGEVSLTATELRLSAQRARSALGELVHVGASVLGQVDAVKLVGRALDTVLERSVARVLRSFRFVEEGETVRAGELDYRAAGLASVRGEHATLTAEKLVKVDGSQIHVG